MAEGYRIDKQSARKLASLLGRDGGNFPNKNGNIHNETYVHVRNKFTEEIPPFAILQPVAVYWMQDSTPVIDVTQYDGTYSGEFLFSSSYPIQVNQIGNAQLGRLVRCFFADGDGSVGTSYGPKADSWDLEEGGSYLMACGAIAERPNQMMAIITGGDSDLVVRFRLTEDLASCDQASAEIVDDECGQVEIIQVVDKIGLAELAFDEITAEPMAPIGSMGYAFFLDTVEVTEPTDPPTDPPTTTTVMRRRFEITALASGCCDSSEPPCPQIPGVPRSVIPAFAGDITNGVTLLGFGETGDDCLYQFAISFCPPCESGEPVMFRIDSVTKSNWSLARPPRMGEA